MIASQGIASSQSVTPTTATISSYNETDSSKVSPLKRASSLPPSRRGVSPNIRITSQLSYSKY